MDECAICGLSKAAHDSPGVHHYFSENGELKQKVTVRPPAQVTIQPAEVVLRLISVLGARGVLQPEDLKLIFGGEHERGPGTGEDRPAGSGEVPA